MSVFAKGIIATIVVPGFLFGTVFLLLSMVLGGKLAYFVEACVTFGVLTLVSLIWFITALGPLGPATAWFPAAIGPKVTSVSFDSRTYNVADYPNGAWQAPGAGKHMADLSGSDDTLAESLQLTPVLNTLVSDAISPIRGLRDQVKPLEQGPIGLLPGKFTVTNIRMEPAVVKGKESIVAVGKAVPSAPTSVPKLPGGATSATIDKYLVSIGQEVSVGQNILAITLPNGQTANLAATDTGVVAGFGPGVGSLIRPNVPILILDISVQPGQPKPVVVVAARVRGALRTPAFFFLLVSLLLFVLHLFGLSRLEKRSRATAVTV